MGIRPGSEEKQRLVVKAMKKLDKDVMTKDILKEINQGSERAYVPRDISSVMGVLKSKG